MGNEKNDDCLDMCNCKIVHEESVAMVREKMITAQLRSEMADFYKIMGDGTRISILHALSFSELCVCDIAALLKMNQSAISHQLRTLRQARLVSVRRDGKVAYYSLNDEHVQGIIELGRIHLQE